ncbi:hypothetical protein P2318_31390 [Myxococcaceae bacterium GXIMD 01537]
MPAALPIRRVVLYKHGVGYLERRGKVRGSETVHLDFKARDMNDVLKSMTVLDLSGGSVSAVSYDSTKPLEQLLQEATIRIPEEGSLTALLGQVKGARVRARVGKELVEGVIVGLESLEVAAGESSVRRPFLTLLVGASLRTFDMLEVAELTFLDEAVRKDLEFYLSTVLSSYKKDAKRMSILTAGEGERDLFVSYVIEAPVWKTSYRILLDEGEPPLLQGWAVVDNTGDEDWVDVELALIAGLPVSFVHDLYSPRYLKRPVVEVQLETGVAPVIPEEAFGGASAGAMMEMAAPPPPAPSAAPGGRAKEMRRAVGGAVRREAALRSAPVKTVTQEVGELFEYRVDRPVTVHRNQSALVPILGRPFEGRRVLLYNRATREKNPMACIELTNTTGLTLEGGPVTVSESDTYVGEAMLDTMKPGDKRFVPFAVELGCLVSVEDSAEDGPVFRASVAHGVLMVEYYQLRKTRYHLRNKAARAQTLYVEHPRTGWQLMATQEPAETTDGFWRFKVELGAGASPEFAVTERTSGTRHYVFTNIGLSDVAFFLSAHYIDEEVARVLREVVGLREQDAELDKEEARLTALREQLARDQERIRANIESLTTGASQRELAERYVTKMNEQEDRLEATDKDLAEVQRRRQDISRDITRRIDSLSYTVELGTPP